MAPPPPPADLETSAQRLVAYHQRKQSLTKGVTPTPSPAPVNPNPRESDEPDERLARSQMAQGWKFFRAGDKAKARTVWLEVFTSYGHTCSGTRARAYVAEAIEKDYGAAALWYEKALNINPKCCMTMFNYGVLLETILNRKIDAMKMYVAASELGDEAAGRRAELLRKSQKE